MRRFILILLLFIFIVALFIFCNSNSVNKAKEIDAILVIRQSDKKEWTLSDKDAIDKFVKALNETFNGFPLKLHLPVFDRARK